MLPKVLQQAGSTSHRTKAIGETSAGKICSGRHSASKEKFTSKQIITAIQNNEQESRKEWMLSIFKQQAEKNCRNTEYQFWRQDNQPKECYSPQFSVQKPNYIHNNPVEAGIVEKAEDYLYSRAKSYHQQKKDDLLDIVLL